MKRILINVNNNQELRIACVDQGKLHDLEINYFKLKKKKLNIYKGKVINVQVSLEAVFIDYGEKKLGFLPFKSISDDYLFTQNSSVNFYSIQTMIQKNQEMIVQISHEERKGKGVQLTTFINLFGNYLVLMPNKKNKIGISHKIRGENRIYIKKNIAKFHLPKNMSLIIRTSGQGKSINILKKDLLVLLKCWERIKKLSQTFLFPQLIYQKDNVIIQILQNYLYNEMDEIIIDNLYVFNLVCFYMNVTQTLHVCNKIKLYSNMIPIFIHYNIEEQINILFERKIILPSGGSIIIDFTEAITVIDVNSYQSHQCFNIEETAFKTNLESIHEITRQLRLRDIGGLIIIDFINMKKISNKKNIEKQLNISLMRDRAYIKIGCISIFGTIELSRQKLHTYFYKHNNYFCPRCKYVYIYD